MKKLVTLSLLLIGLTGCNSIPAKTHAINADSVQGLSDAAICRGLGQAQKRHDKAAYNVLSDELTQRERGKVFKLTQGECTGLAVAEINKK
ncbi:hypothetical protein FER63_23455 [Salmonella enterica]|nr:hypothetical protein [Salmonella enterica]